MQHDLSRTPILSAEELAEVSARLNAVEAGTHNRDAQFEALKTLLKERQRARTKHRAPPIARTNMLES